MKVEKNIYSEEDLNQYDHFSTNLKTPIRKDAFNLSDKEKVEIIKTKVTDIIQTLGLDLNDDSIKGTPKRVAEMYVNEIFSGLNPKNKPKAPKTKLNESLKTSQPIPKPIKKTIESNPKPKTPKKTNMKKHQNGTPRGRFGHCGVRSGSKKRCESHGRREIIQR